MASFYSCCELQLHLVPKNGFVSEESPHTKTHTPVKKPLFETWLCYTLVPLRGFDLNVFFLKLWDLKCLHQGPSGRSNGHIAPLNVPATEALLVTLATAVMLNPV